MSKGKKIFISVILAAVLAFAGLYVWNPEARKVSTLAELTGDFAEFERCFVTEIIGVEDTNLYELTEKEDIINMKKFLKEAEISYVGRVGDVKEFDGSTTYRMVLALDDNRFEFEMDVDGKHIYAGDVEYMVTDSADMILFHESLPQTLDTAASRFQALGQQLAEHVAEYLEILKGKAGTVIGEYLEPIYKEYVDHMLNNGKVTNAGMSREDVIENIKRAQFVNYLAEKYNLEPEKAFIDEQVQMTRQIAESDIDASVGVEALIRELGISADDFWNVYQWEGQRTAWCISNIEQYIADNNLPSIEEMMEEMDTEFIIHDQAYFDSIG